MELRGRQEEKGLFTFYWEQGQGEDKNEEERLSQTQKKVQSVPQQCLQKTVVKAENENNKFLQERRNVHVAYRTKKRKEKFSHQKPSKKQLKKSFVQLSFCSSALEVRQKIQTNHPRKTNSLMKSFIRTNKIQDSPRPQKLFDDKQLFIKERIPRVSQLISKDILALSSISQFESINSLQRSQRDEVKANSANKLPSVELNKYINQLLFRKKIAIKFPEQSRNSKQKTPALQLRHHQHHFTQFKHQKMRNLHPKQPMASMPSLSIEPSNQHALINIMRRSKRNI